MEFTSKIVTYLKRGQLLEATDMLYEASVFPKNAKP